MHGENAQSPRLRGVCFEPVIGLEIDGLGVVTSIDWIAGVFTISGMHGVKLPFGTYSRCIHPKPSGDSAMTAIDVGRYPHACPHCTGPAYVGFNRIDCARACRG